MRIVNQSVPRLINKKTAPVGKYSVLTGAVVVVGCALLLMCFGVRQRAIRCRQRRWGGLRWAAGG